MFIVNSLASLSKNTLQIDQNHQTQTTNLKNTKKYEQQESFKSLADLPKLIHLLTENTWLHEMVMIAGMVHLLPV